MIKREYIKPQVKIHVPRLEHMICNGTNGEQTINPWGKGDDDDWGGFNTNRNGFFEEEEPQVNVWK